MGDAKFQTDGLNLTFDLLRYVRGAVVRESPVQVALREKTAERSDGRMMISPEQGQSLGWIVRLLRPRRIIEIGVFTGYSATWLAAALEPGGTLVACDIDAETLEQARVAWRQAGLAGRIVPRSGPATETLQELLNAGWGGSVDAVFIDADKQGYLTYYDLAYELLRPGGVMLFDNVLWGGSVADPSVTDPTTQALRDVTAKAARDSRVFTTLFTDGDGILAVFKPFPAAPAPAGNT